MFLCVKGWHVFKLELYFVIYFNKQSLSECLDEANARFSYNLLTFNSAVPFSSLMAS